MLNTILKHHQGQRHDGDSLLRHKWNIIVAKNAEGTKKLDEIKKTGWISDFL